MIALCGASLNVEEDRSARARQVPACDVSLAVAALGVPQDPPGGWPPEGGRLVPRAPAGDGASAGKGVRPGIDSRMSQGPGTYTLGCLSPSPLIGLKVSYRFVKYAAGTGAGDRPT